MWPSKPEMLISVSGNMTDRDSITTETANRWFQIEIASQLKRQIDGSDQLELEGD